MQTFKINEASIVPFIAKVTADPTLKAYLNSAQGLDRNFKFNLNYEVTSRIENGSHVPFLLDKTMLDGLFDLGCGDTIEVSYEEKGHISGEQVFTIVQYEISEFDDFAFQLTKVVQPD